jgi:hypothetical protein
MYLLPESPIFHAADIPTMLALVVFIAAVMCAMLVVFIAAVVT